MHSFKKTKIVATIGPASDSEEKIAELIKAGVNVFRFNMKHADIPWHNERISRVQKVADSLGQSIGILIDLQGPEIRLETPEKANISVQKDEIITFVERFTDSNTRVVSIPHGVVFNVLKAGDSLLIDDGFLEFVITEAGNNQLKARALDDCVIKHRKGINIPGKMLDLPSLIEDDLQKLEMASRTKVDFVALSFSRTKKDIEILKSEMEKRKLEAMVVAKIESQQALDNIDDLIEASDAIMVARGDLGIEVPIEELAYWQKLIIKKCRVAKKPVITATQMLQSMIDNPRPTRAEATDVANAVFDGTDAIMLSGETASGRYPVKAVSAMARIAHYNEKFCLQPKVELAAHKPTELIVEAAISMAENSTKVPIDAFLVFTETGYTARALACFRPKAHIIAITDEQKTVEELSLSYGVIGFFTQFPSGEFHSYEHIVEKLMQKGILHKDQTVLVIHGKRWKTPGLTNALTLVQV